MNQMAYFCPNDDKDLPLSKRTHECYMTQEIYKIFDGRVITNWIKCNTCGHELCQVVLDLPAEVEVISPDKE